MWQWMHGLPEEEPDVDGFTLCPAMSLVNHANHIEKEGYDYVRPTGTTYHRKAPVGISMKA